MNTAKPEGSEPVAGPVERPVRPLAERLRANIDSWAPTSDESLAAHLLMEEAASVLEHVNETAEVNRRLFSDAARYKAIAEEWQRLCDPLVLHVNLLRGVPAKLDRDVFLHLAGEKAGELVCTKCGANRAKEPCRRGHHEEITGKCPMSGVAA